METFEAELTQDLSVDETIEEVNSILSNAETSSKLGSNALLNNAKE
jgi:hypothetical protein